MQIIKINGKEYKARQFDFDLLCDLEDLGVPFEEIDSRQTSIIRAYLAACSGRGRDYAGKELNSHVLNGGTLDEITSAMKKEIAESDFFQALDKRAEEKDTTVETEKSQENPKKK